MRGGGAVRVGMFYPSSKTCSCCGHVLENLPLSVRYWRCPECGKGHDRDVNAARSILAEGLRILGGGTVPQGLREPRPRAGNASGAGIRPARRTPRRAICEEGRINGFIHGERQSSILRLGPGLDSKWGIRNPPRAASPEPATRATTANRRTNAATRPCGCCRR